MHLSIDFQRNGHVKVFALVDDVTVSVTAPVNQLQALLPSAVFDAVRERMVQFIEITAQAPQLRAVR